MTTGTKLAAALACIAMVATPLSYAHAAAEQQSLEEIRNTVINLLQALVDQGVMSKEKAEQLVKQAQAKAAADTTAAQVADEGAVRVPYVPQIVKDEISKQVTAAVTPVVVAQVIDQAQTEKWGIPGALPDWLSRVRVYGEVRLRAQGDFFSSDNEPNFYLDFNTVNSKGGIGKAGAAALLNVTENRERMRVRARFGLEAKVLPNLTAGIRLTTGTLQDPGSANQTLGNYGARFTASFDQVYLRWEERTAGEFPWLTVSGGRMASPWFTPTDLVYHKELNFDGVAATGRFGFGDGTPQQSHLFATIGAFPMQEVELSAKDKWLYGAQLGANLRWGDSQRLRAAISYFDFENVTGRRNAADSTLYDYTAPQFVRNGNTLFDIRNDTDASTNLFALAAKFQLVQVAASYELPLGAYALGFAGEAVRNIGFDEQDVFQRTGTHVQRRNMGYQVEGSFGHSVLIRPWQWRATLGYRYLQRDAVLDAWTDSDFRGGGTDVAGYYLTGDIGVGPRTWVRVRYMSANEIDGAPFGEDVLMVDLNAQF